MFRYRILILTALAGLTITSWGCGDDDDEPTSEPTTEPTEPTAPTGPADTSLPGDPVAGEPIYTSKCIACHGADGRGNGGIGGDFIGEPERLQQDNAILLEKIAKGITGNRVMPPHDGVLSEEEQKNALAYIRSAFGSQAE